MNIYVALIKKLDLVIEVYFKEIIMYEDSSRYDNLHGDEDYIEYEALQLKYDREEQEFEEYEHE